MLWCRCVLSFKMGGRCVLSFKMGFWVCGSRGVRDVHVISCTRVVQIGVACNRAVNWWDEEVKEVIRVRRKAHARHTSNKTTAGWEEYAIARK